MDKTTGGARDPIDDGATKEWDAKANGRHPKGTQVNGDPRGTATVTVHRGATVSKGACPGKVQALAAAPRVPTPSLVPAAWHSASRSWLQPPAPNWKSMANTPSSQSTMSRLPREQLNKQLTKLQGSHSTGFQGSHSAQLQGSHHVIPSSQQHAPLPARECDRIQDPYLAVQQADNPLASTIQPSGASSYRDRPAELAIGGIKHWKV